MPRTPERISRYPIIRQLGEGGMGQVYLARDPDLDRRVALKVLRGDSADDVNARKRLRHEARTLAALNHPGIVTIYEVGRDSDLDFIAMEYLDGLSLRDALEAPGKPPSTPTLLAAAAQVARALDAAHSAGVLHRDIKPDNVMIDKSGAVKVVDFGIAHRMRAPSAPPLARSRTPSPFAHTLPLDLSKATMVTNTIFGTPGYMAPEVLLGQKATAESDVYSLGVMLYETLTGALPYAAGTGEELLDALKRVVDENVGHPPIGDRRPDLSDPVCRLIERMLSKRSTARPTMSEVAAGLEATGETDSRPFNPMLAEDALVPRASSAAPTMPAQLPPAAFETQETSGAPEPRRWPAFLAVAIVVFGVIVSATIALTRREEPAETAPATTTKHRVVVANLEGRFSGYGNSPPSGRTLADVMTETLASIGVDVIKIAPGERQGDVATLGAEAGADTVLAIRIEHTDDEVVASMELAATDGEVLLAREIRAATLAEVMFECARATAALAAPEREEPSSNEVAEVAFQLGLVAYAERRYATAMPFFEQAVNAKPDFPSAWYYLSWSRAWVAAPREQSLDAADRAEKTAKTEHERRLGAALKLYLDHRFRDAVLLLKPLLAKAPRDRDLLYLYAESLFHDGQINNGVEYFERCLATAPTFQPARTHLREVAEARRSFGDIRRLYGSDTDKVAGVLAYLEGDDDRARQLGYSTFVLDVMARDYEALDKAHENATHGKAIAFRLARLLEQNRRADARRLFRDNWAQLEREGAEPAGAFGLQMIGRVLLIGELRGELEVVRDWWQKNDTPSNLTFRREIEIFSPPVLGEKPADHAPAALTSRELATQRALALEREAPDRAAVALRALADEPAGSYRDYTLQHAFIRVLRKLGKKDEIKRRCELWSRPAYFDPSVIVLRRACDTALE